MARFGNLPQQTIVDMYNPLNIGFYKDILDNAQSNLNQGAAMQAKVLEDAYGVQHIDEATHQAQVDKLKQNVAGLLEPDFVSPANVIRGISKAGQEFSPYKNLAAKHVEEVKRQKEQQDRWGSNWIGNNVANMQLTDPNTGQLISPNKIRGISGNQEDLITAIAKDNAGIAERVTELPGGWSTILGGKAYEKKTLKIKGITETQRINDYVKNNGLVKKYMEQLPGFTEAVAASGMNPEEYVARALDTWSKQLVRGEEVDSKYIDNLDYGKGAGAVADYNRFLPKSYSDPVEIKGIDREFNLTDVGKVRKVLHNEAKDFTGFLSSTSKTKGTLDEVTKVLPVMFEMRQKYPDLYERANSMSGNYQQKGDKFLDLVVQAEAGVIPTNAKGNVISTNTRWDINTGEVDNGIQRGMIAGNPSYKVKSTNGEKETTLGEIADKRGIPTFKDNGDIILSTPDNNYVWDTSSDEGLNALDNASKQVVKLQRKLYNQKWSDTPTKEVIPTGVTDLVPGTQKEAGVAFIVKPSKNNQANKFYKVYYAGVDADGSLDLYYEGNSDNPIEIPVSFDEVSKVNAIALSKLNLTKSASTSNAVKE